MTLSGWTEATVLLLWAVLVSDVCYIQKVHG